MGKQTEEVKLHGNGMQRPTPESGNANEKTQDLKALDIEKLDDPELLSSVEDRLANLRDMTGPVKSGRKNPAAEDETEGGDDESAESDEKKTGEDKPNEPDSPTLDGDGKKEKEGEHVLPEAYKRCAVTYGWKESDVDEFFERDPERALATLSNIYQTRNKASATFAAIGRKAREEQANKETGRPTFKQVDAAKLREQYGEDAGPLIEMIEAQNKTLQQLAEQLPREKPKQAKAFESAVEESGVEQQIYNFFQSDRMKAYGKVYGTLGIGETWDDLAPGQREHRMKVLERADEIAAGSKLRGVDLSLDEVLEDAHLLVTQKYRDQILVEGVKANVVQRSKGITLKPSKGTRKPGESVADSDKPGTRTREQLLEATQRKLGRMFG